MVCLSSRDVRLLMVGAGVSVGLLASAFLAGSLFFGARADHPIKEASLQQTPIAVSTIPTATSSPIPSDTPSPMLSSETPSVAAPAKAVYHSIGGSFIVRYPTWDKLGSGAPAFAEGDCRVAGAGYDDVHRGTQVTVSDESGSKVAIGALGPGSLVDTKREYIPEVPGTPGITDTIPGFWTETGYCSYTLVIKGVPDATIYAVEVAHRGQVSVTRQELVRTGWTMNMTLGDG